MSSHASRKLLKEETAAKRKASLQYIGNRTDSANIGWIEQLTRMPQDTRTLTARFFGDPLPGRSALDRRHG